MKKIINIEGMSCGHCVGRINKALSAIEGLNGVDINLDEKRALVTLDQDVTDEKIKVEIENSGYKVVGIKSI